jgi:hypothetical protein
MRGAGHEDVLVVLQVSGNKAGAVPYFYGDEYLYGASEFK